MENNDIPHDEPTTIDPIQVNDGIYDDQGLIAVLDTNPDEDGTATSDVNMAGDPDLAVSDDTNLAHVNGYVDSIDFDGKLVCLMTYL